MTMQTQPAKGHARSSGYAPVPAGFYAEMPESADAIIAAEKLEPPLWCWDPAAGSGNIPARLHAKGIPCIASDIADRGCCAMIKNFLAPEQFPFITLPPDTVIISNPPFELTASFVSQAIEYKPERVIVFQRLLWLEGKERGAWFQRTGLTRVWVHSGRQRLAPNGVPATKASGSVAYAWFTWQRGHSGPWTGGFLP